MDEHKRGLIGVSANLAVATVLLPNRADVRFQPLHPTPLALMPLPPRPRWRNRVDDHGEDADDRGDDEAEEQRRGRREREEHGKHRASKAQGLGGVDLVRTDWMVD